VGDLERALASVVGAAQVLVDDDVRSGYEVDWTGRFRGRTPAVVRPGSADEVAGVLAVCRSLGAAVVPQGGNTGLVGGGVPLAGEVVLSLRRLATVGPVDRLAAQVTAGAGATLEAVSSAAAPCGLDVGVDLAARGSATIGGMVATNAGGLRHLRHGAMRSAVAGIEAVLADGSVVSHLGGLAKDNTGYDLAGLLCGSEGTLGVVTAVRLRLVPRLGDDLTTALVGFSSVDDALVAMRAAGVLEAAEVMFPSGLALLGTPPVSAPVVVLFEWAGSSPGVPDLPGVLDAAVATSSSQRAALWWWREAHTEAVNRLGPPPHKLDVTLPLGGLSGFVASVPSLVPPGATVVVWGHLADGNLHVNVVGPPPDDDSVDDAVLRAVAAAGGSISAEHGIGTAKKRWLALGRSEAEIAAFRAVKRALDPDGLLNPNVLLP
jgi:FAD/FMN-containing dehydrogenase